MRGYTGRRLHIAIYAAGIRQRVDGPQSSVAVRGGKSDEQAPPLRSAIKRGKYFANPSFISNLDSVNIYICIFYLNASPNHARAPPAPRPPRRAGAAAPARTRRAIIGVRAITDKRSGLWGAGRAVRLPDRMDLKLSLSLDLDSGFETL